MLTDVEIKKAEAPAKGKKKKLHDAGGLMLVITHGGGRHWRMRFKLKGVEQVISLGPYPKVTLAKARTLRDEAQASLRAGTVPAGRKRDPVVLGSGDSAPAPGPTFEDCAQRWHQAQKARWKTHHAADVLSSFEADVFPQIGALPVSSIKSPQVLAVVRAIEPRSVDIARRVRQRISAVFCYAVAEGTAEADPAAPITKAMAPYVKGQRQAITNLVQARAMLKAVESEPAHPVTKLAHRLLALTALRPGELRKAEWREFEGLDGPTPLWRVPGPRMKMKREHLVPLTAQAVDVLAAARTLSGGLPLVFPSTRDSRVAISENAIGFMINRAGFRGQHVPHGWRATFSTVMNERNPGDGDVIELMLAHMPEDEVRAAYNRALHMDRRRALATAWAGLIGEGAVPLDELLSGPRR